MARLPYYFYDINARLPDGRMRWIDEFADAAPSIIQPRDLSYSFQRAKRLRNEAYSKWIASFFVRTGEDSFIPLLKGKQFKWQVIQVLEFKHSEFSHRDWWEDYQDALFRVFVQPETFYCERTGEHKQWYLLSPEDSYLVNRYELEKKGPSLPPREYHGREQYLSADKRLRQALLIPVECCRHWRHETTAGQLPEGL